MNLPVVTCCALVTLLSALLTLSGAQDAPLDLPLPKDFVENNDYAIGKLVASLVRYQMLHRKLQADKHDADKRAPAISVTQDLMSLAQMLHGDANRRKVQATQSFLSSLGKRSVLDPVVSQRRMQLQNAASQDALSQEVPRELYQRGRRGQISVGIPLDAISDMIQAQRRRQYEDKALTTRERLLKIGKRSLPDVPVDREEEVSIQKM